MADENQELQEKKIPVLTVFKKGLLFKNIFLLDKNTSPPPSISHPQSIKSLVIHNPKDEDEEILIVGRHPDCNIMLEHPSISRFHLEIHLQPSLQKLFVTDLSSAHGTWVSDRKIEPHVRVELREGDTMKLAASSRLYRLHWYPVCRAFDVQNPYVPLNFKYLLPSVEEEEEKMLKEEDLVSFKQNPSPSAPPMLEPMVVSLHEEPLSPYSVRNEDESHNLIGAVDQCLAPESVHKLSPSLSPIPEPINSTLPEEEALSPYSLCHEGESHNLTVAVDRNLTPEFVNFPFTRNPRPSAPPMPENMSFTFPEEDLLTYPIRNVEECHNLTGAVNQSLVPPSVYSPESHGKRVLSETIEDEADKGNQESVPTISTEFAALAEGYQENMQCTSENGSKKLSLWSRRGKPARLLRVQTALSERENIELYRVVEALSENHTEVEDELSTKVLLSGSDGEAQTFTPDKENSTPRTVLKSNSSKKGTRGELKLQWSYGSLSPSRDEDKGMSPFSDKENRTPAQENYTPKTVLGSNSAKKGSCRELGLQWSYGSLSSNRDEDNSISPFSDRENQTPILLPVSRGKKPLSVSRLGQEAEMNKSKRNSERLPLQSMGANSMSNGKSNVLVPRTNTTNNSSVKCDLEELTPKALFTGSDYEEEIFTPGKENYTPKAGNVSNSVKKGRRLELELQKSGGQLSVRQGMSPSSEKENITPKGVHDDARLKTPLSGSRLPQEADDIKSKRRSGRVPFQSLVVNSSDSPIPLAQTGSSDTANCDKKTNTSLPFSAKQSPGEPSRKWYMMVDTNCLLNKETRRSLQLMKGLNGTQLIIPRTVIRELEALKRRASLFGSATEVSLVLQWIDECLVEAESWIDVQNPMEEHIPATPPASPSWSSWLSGESKHVFGRSMPLLPWSSLEAIVSPTAEDHILDCALLYKNMKNDGQLVLLSNDIALKIKAMAEGVLCETAEEFRASLIDPYSTRFLWSGSTPRGPTWSYLEEADAKENYCYVPVKSRFSRAADSAKKGLKLILRHKYSHYGQMASVR